jgi:hypothetical protein
MAEEIKVADAPVVVEVESKKWFESKTIIALIVPAVLQLYKAIQVLLLSLGVYIPEIPVGTPEAIVDLISGIGIVAGMFFRFVSTKPIK